MSSEPTVDCFNQPMPVAGSCHEAAYKAWKYGSSSRNSHQICEALGIDPGMSLGRLREDLEIAARVRACTVVGTVVALSPFPERQYLKYADDLLAFLRGDEQ